jgi:hypothetical protein
MVATKCSHKFPRLQAEVRSPASPPEEEIDNPAGWSMFTFTPSYHPKTKKYDGHTTPSGAHVVPPDGTGKRVMNGWDFHYKNWKAEDFDVQTYVRTGAKFGDL